MPQGQNFPSTNSKEIDSEQFKSTINKRIVRLSMANIAVLVIWYLLSAEHQSPLSVDGVAEFDIAYKILLLVLAAFTLGLWVSLTTAFWQKLRISAPSESSTKDNIQ